MHHVTACRAKEGGGAAVATRAVIDNQPCAMPGPRGHRWPMGDLTLTFSRFKILTATTWPVIKCLVAVSSQCGMMAVRSARA